MKKFTNHTPGPRGINTAEGTVWIEPGQSVEIDAEDIIGSLPDLGRAPRNSADDDGAEALKAKLTDLTKQVETLTADNKALTKDKADLTKQVETLTKPK